MHRTTQWPRRRTRGGARPRCPNWRDACALWLCRKRPWGHCRKRTTAASTADGLQTDAAISHSSRRSAPHAPKARPRRQAAVSVVPRRIDDVMERIEKHQEAIAESMAKVVESMALRQELLERFGEQGIATLGVVATSTSAIARHSADIREGVEQVAANVDEAGEKIALLEGSPSHRPKPTGSLPHVFACASLRGEITRLRGAKQRRTRCHRELLAEAGGWAGAHGGLYHVSRRRRLQLAPLRYASGLRVTVPACPHPAGKEDRVQRDRPR